MGGEGAGKILALSSMFPFLKFASIFAFYFQLSRAIFAAFAFFGGRGLSSLLRNEARFRCRTFQEPNVWRLNQLGTPVSIWNGSAVLFV